MSDDVRVPIGQMSQAWSDIQGYTSNMWQISALCLTVVALSLNLFVSSIGLETPPPSWTWQSVLLLALVFVIITIYTIQWLRASIVRRVVYIMKTEETIAVLSSKRSLVGSTDLFNVTEGPMKALLYFFYLLASVLGILVVYPLLDVLVLAQLSPNEWTFLIAIAFTITTALLSLYRNYRVLRRREKLVGITAETTVEPENHTEEITPLKLAYTNTIMKQVLGVDIWFNFDLSVWYNKDDQPWKLLTYSIHFPESLRSLEIPYAPILEFMINDSDEEYYGNAEELSLAYPLLGKLSNTLADESTRLWLIKVKKPKLLAILRETGAYAMSNRDILKLRNGISLLIEEIGKDIFSEIETI